MQRDFRVPTTQDQYVTGMPKTTRIMQNYQHVWSPIETIHDLCTCLHNLAIAAKTIFHEDILSASEIYRLSEELRSIYDHSMGEASLNRMKAIALQRLSERATALRGVANGDVVSLVPLYEMETRSGELMKQLKDITATKIAILEGQREIAESDPKNHTYETIAGKRKREPFGLFPNGKFASYTRTKTEKKKDSGSGSMASVTQSAIKAINEAAAKAASKAAAAAARKSGNDTPASPEPCLRCKNTTHQFKDCKSTDPWCPVNELPEHKQSHAKYLRRKNKIDYVTGKPRQP